MAFSVAGIFPEPISILFLMASTLSTGRCRKSYLYFHDETLSDNWWPYLGLLGIDRICSYNACVHDSLPVILLFQKRAAQNSPVHKIR